MVSTDQGCPSDLLLGFTSTQEPSTPGEEGFLSIEIRDKHAVKLLINGLIKPCECDQSLIITRFKK